MWNNLRNIVFGCVILAITATLCFSKENEGHGGHNEDTSELLFRLQNPIPVNARKFKALTNALYLSVDSTTDSSAKFRRVVAELKEFGISISDKDIEKIVFIGNQHHEQYTHKGWGYHYCFDSTLQIDDSCEYGQNQESMCLGNRYVNHQAHCPYGSKPSKHCYASVAQARWMIRKGILEKTVTKVFGFMPLIDERKRDSMSALLYYTHLLGDHEGNDNSTSADRMQLSSRNREDITIFSELEKHLSILFSKKVGTYDYDQLIKYIQGNKSNNFDDSTVENYAEIQRLAKETLEELEKHVPKLLAQENFFRKTFS